MLWSIARRRGSKKYSDFIKKCRVLGKDIWNITGKKDVDIVFEHPGESTFPVSCYLVKTGGMVVICAGTSGYNLTMDARYIWMRQKKNSRKSLRKSLSS